MYVQRHSGVIVCLFESDVAEQTSHDSAQIADVEGRIALQDVDRHSLVVAGPVGLDQPGLRMPAHGDRQAPVAAEEVPVGPGVDALCEGADFAFGRVEAVIVAPGEQDAEQQQGGVDGGQFHLLETQPRPHV